MSSQIIGNADEAASISGLGLIPSLDDWLSPASRQGTGCCARDWFMPHFASSVNDIFGFHAVQMGASSINTLANSRIAHKWCIADTVQDTRASFYANASALPFFEATLDLVTLPLTLDAHSDPETVIDEVARVLVPEGRVVIAGFNTKSLWGVAHKLGKSILPEGCQPFGYKRLQAALTDLGLVVDHVQFGAYGVPNSALQRDTLLERLSSQYLPMLGGLYFVVARKRVMGVRPKRRLAWRLPKLSDVIVNTFPNPNPSGVRHGTPSSDASA